jgi:ERCC4-related helicase/predicted nucleic acid-binding Zn finger protein
VEQNLFVDITEVLEKLLISDRFKSNYILGEKLYQAGSVQILSQGKEYFEVEVEDTFDDFNVSFKFDEKLAGDCSCKAVDWCSHRVAGIMQVKESLERTKPHSNEEGKAYTREGMIKRVLAERAERAAKEEYKLVYADNIHGEHKLINAKGIIYKVTLRDFENKQGYCTCSDFATNKLGTCKHLIFAFNATQTVKQKQPYPFIEVYLDPLKDNLITWFYPERLPEEVENLVKLYFEKDGTVALNKVMTFFGFIKEAKKHKQILIRPGVLDKIEREFDNHILEQKKSVVKLDFSLIRATLYPYQKEGVEFATFSKGMIIADEMGLGKTLQAISTAVFKKQIFGFKKTLVISPASLKSQWKSEIEKFSDEKAEVVEGFPDERTERYLNSDAYFLIINYETVLRDITVLNKANIDFIILDEAQRIKNFETVTANAIKSIRKSHSLVITGTPIENKLADIYSIVGFIDPALLAPLWEFSYQHCYFDKQNGNKITGYYNLQLLKEKLKPVLLRREKKDVLSQLNNITHIDVPVEMHPIQRDFHTSYAQSISAILGKKFKTSYDWQMVTMYLQSMRMACDSSFLVDKETSHSPKLIELEEILLEKLDLRNNSRKIIIFSEWTTMLAIIGKMLVKNGISYTELTGKVPVKNRKKIIKEFEENPECRVFLSTEAGGSGLNLQVADTVINFELPWNPAKKNQRVGRIDRLGQENKNLTVINLITRDSIEMRIVSGLLVKQDLFDSVLNSDNFMDEVDFSEKGRSQFLKQLEDSMAEFSDFSNTEMPSEAAADVTAFVSSEPAKIDIIDHEEKIRREAQETKLTEMEQVMSKGMEFLAGLFKMSTGKDLTSGNNTIEIDRETGEVVMRFKIEL